MTNDRLVNATIQRWKLEPWTFVREAFKVQPDVWQDEGLHEIVHVNRLGFKACKGPGKTALLAWIILWFLMTREQCRIGATSITEANIRSNLWPELAYWMKKSQVVSAALAWTKTAVVNRADPSSWYCHLRTWPKHGDQQQQADALAGLHAPHVMFVLDEAGGIPQSVMVAAEAVLANVGSEAKLLIAGNPTHTTGPLYRACTMDASLWRIITITGDPDSPRRSPRISLQWARDMIKQYGRENPWVKVNVLGEFPPISINALLGVEEVNRAMSLKLDPLEYAWAQKRLGVDVARFGDDRTVIFARQGRMGWKPVIMRNADTAQIAARVALNHERWGADGQPVERIYIDDTGHWGHGVLDQLLTGGFPATPVIYHAPAVLPQYKNVRSHNWLKMADGVRNGARLPILPEMIPELTEITYTFLGGQFLLEPKEMVKDRLGWSPDIADAYAQTYHEPDMPAMGVGFPLVPGGKVVTRRDPMSAALLEHRAAGTPHLEDHAPFPQ